MFSFPFVQRLTLVPMNCNVTPIAVGVTVQLRTTKGENGNETFSFIGIVHPLYVYGSSICR